MPQAGNNGVYTARWDKQTKSLKHQHFLILSTHSRTLIGMLWEREWEEMALLQSTNLPRGHRLPKTLQAPTLPR